MIWNILIILCLIAWATSVVFSFIYTYKEIRAINTFAELKYSRDKFMCLTLMWMFWATADIIYSTIILK